MLRVASCVTAVAFLLPTLPLDAQQAYAGTWVMQGTSGPVTLSLNPPGGDGVHRGTIAGNGISFRIESQDQGDRLIGFALAGDGNGGVYFEAMLEGASLRVLFADVDQAGQPLASTAQQYVFQRGSGPAPGPAPGRAGGLLGRAGGQPRAAPGPQGAPQGGAPGGIVGHGPQDGQIAQLLTSSPWCSFSYSGSATGTGGTTAQERNVFRPDGVLISQGGSESSYSGNVNDQYGNELVRGGTVGGQQSGAMFRWRVDNGVLYLSQDGAQWAPLPLQFSQNSNGYPIITAGGTEYYQCN